MSNNEDKQIGIAILAKAPIPGLTKTRLIPHLGAAGAAALQRWLLQRTVATALSADIGPVTLWCAPDTQHTDFANCARQGPLTLRQQPDGDLGERMRIALAESPSPAGTLVIGTDCPLLDAAHLRHAAAALTTHEAVLTPAEDGGYVLIGMRQVANQLFSGMAWSTDRVLLQTRQRLAEIGWQWIEFKPFWDVDRKEDFERLARLFPELASLAASVSDRPPLNDTVRS
ncbi:MAG TPA: TIGR04282 family arsenosugar biosynthesis glycosyltransferase [Azonexus sp.]|nr:TIGR04282 family arsenosugar biosynthesis glycosyltransferase [Azonexus sp.]